MWVREEVFFSRVFIEYFYRLGRVSGVGEVSRVRRMFWVRKRGVITGVYSLLGCSFFIYELVGVG